MFINTRISLYYNLWSSICVCVGFPGGSVVNNPPINAGDADSVLGRKKDPLEKEMATHSNILAWEIPWTREPGRLKSMVSQRVENNLVTKQQHFCIYIWYMEKEMATHASILAWKIPWMELPVGLQCMGSRLSDFHIHTYIHVYGI